MDNRRKRNRTHYIHRLNYSAQEKLAGSFVLLAISVLVWLLLSSQKTRNLFEEEYILYGAMDTIQAINEGTNVIVSGLNVGRVINVEISDRNEFVVTMSVLKKYQKLIRADSRAELLSFKFALIGKSVIEISVGSNTSPILKDNAIMQIHESINLLKTLEKVEPVLDILQDSIQRTNAILGSIDPEQVRISLEAMQSLLVKTEEIIGKIDPNKIASSINNLEKITSNTDRIVQQIQSGKGVAGNIIYNNKLNQDIKTSTKNLTQITEQMKILLSTMQEQVYDIPELTSKIKPLLDEADKTIKATQKIWPISGAIRKDSKQSLTVPGAME